MNYKIGTRGSKLALVQANYVCKRLQEQYPQHSFEIKVIQTQGDKIQNKPLNQIGTKGVFVKEIEEQILADEVQIGVHSMKDMPAQPAEGLLFTRAWKREDPRDVLILREKKSFAELPEGAVIGTGSMRRKVQLLRMRSDIRVVDIRGNVDTRLRKMEEQKLDGIVLAAAGLHRLGLEHLITQYFTTEEMISAPAQGILALEISEKRGELKEMLDALSEEETEVEATAERGFLAEIGGDCHVPVGASCVRNEDGTLTLAAMFGDESGEKTAYTTIVGTNPQALAKEAALEIRKQMER